MERPKYLIRSNCYTFLLFVVKYSVELMDVSSSLPGLKYSSGVTHWFPSSRDLTFFNHYEEVPEKWRTVVRPNMFPPNTDEAHKYNLDRCIRIFPHHQNTGGFFVAVLRKSKLLPWEKKVTSTSASLCSESAEVNNSEPINNAPNYRRTKKKMKLGYKEDPYIFFTAEETLWPLIRDFYGLVENEFFPSCLFTRCEVGKKKNIYLASRLVKNIILSNKHRIKFINSGIKVLARCDSRTMGCSFRLTHEGLSSIHSFVGVNRKVTISKAELIKILLHHDPNEPLNVSELEEETKKNLSEMGTGSCILTLNDEKLPIKLVGWKGTQTLRAYITVPDSIHYLRMLGEDVSQFDVNKFKKENIEDQTISNNS